MSDPSDDETLIKCSPPSVQYLIRQNKIKDIALSKATNLIELLNIELEVQRNGQQQNMRQLEQELKQAYEAKIAAIQKKHATIVDSLNQNFEREIDRIKGGSLQQSRQRDKAKSSTFKTISKSMSNSSIHKRSTINKKYTQFKTNQSIDHNPTKSFGFSSLSQGIFRQQLLQIDEWRQNIHKQLQILIANQYQQLGELITSMQAISQDYEEVMNYTKKKFKENSPLLWKLIKEQQGIINSMRSYSQELEDSYKNVCLKISAFLRKQQIIDQCARIDLQGPATDILRAINRRKQFWKLEKADLLYEKKQVQKVKNMQMLKNGQITRQYGDLQRQNAQLKNLMEDMIELVKQKRNKK